MTPCMASFDGDVAAKDGKLIVNGKEIAVYACMDPAEIHVGRVRR